MSNWRKNIYDVINTDNDGIASRLYSAAMLVFIVMSLIPLAFREETKVFTVFDKVSVSVFVVDYVLRWLTADYAMPEKKHWQAFLVYPFTPFAIIDLLSILPSFITIAHRAFKLLRITRLMKILRVVRLIRYSRNMQILIRVLRKERHILRH